VNNALRPFAFVALAGISCGGQPSEEGNIAALRMGSIVTDLAPRRTPEQDLAASCGDGAPTGAGARALRRLPFTQQVETDRALIVFQTTQPEPAEIEVTKLDGTPVALVAAEPDASFASSQRIARISGLEPATSYCYSVRGLTAPSGFRTAPAAGSREAVRFAAWGDSGYAGSDQRALFEQVMTVPFDFVIHTGDLAYDHGSPGDLTRTVFEPYGPLLRRFAMYPVTGNHDYETNRAAPFLQSFVLPENGDHERWYSFDWSDVHFVGLDTEQTGKRQAEWLDADLLQNRLPWTVVFAHKPPFSFGEHGSNTAFREHFVPVLEKYQVPLVLNGHDHDYERTVVMNGVTYVVTGGGGRGTRPVGRSSFTAFSQAVIHFVYVEISGNRLVLHAIDGTGREFDQAVIERSAG
jgi:acid phosphatase type 7